MKLQNNFCIVHTNNGFVLYNVESKEKFLLDNETIIKLASSDAGMQSDFQEAGIASLNEKKWQPHEYGLIGKLFRNEISIEIEDLKALNGNEFWEEYLALCETTVSNIERSKEKKFSEKIALPKHKPFTADFYTLLKQRRTVREFNGEYVKLQELADILFTSCGQFHENFEEKYLDATNGMCWRRSSPSVGGLNCVEPYVFIDRVHGLEKGIYFYNSKTHELSLVTKEFKEEDLTTSFLKQEFAKNSAFSILFVANLDMLATKYPHIRSMVFPFLDVGHLAQTAILTGGALNIKSWITSALCDEYLMKLCKLEEYQMPLEAVVFGHGINESLGPKIRKKIEEVLSKRFNIGAKIFAKVSQKIER